MREKDWEILTVGDRVQRVKYSFVEEKVAPLRGGTEMPTSEQLRAALATEVLDFQVMAIQPGMVIAVRLIERHDTPGQRSAVTETVELTHAVAVAELPSAAYRGFAYEWRYNAPARGESRLTGGFTVKRADGREEYERCPTETTRK